MVGHTQRWVVPDHEPTFDELMEAYGGSTAAIAQAAGMGTAAQARARGADAVRRRENFMRSLRKYRQGTRLPAGDRQRMLRNLTTSARRRQATPRTAQAVVDLMALHGFTFHGVALVLISSDEVVKVWTTPGWWVSPAVFAEEGLGGPLGARQWPASVMPVSMAMGRVYGVPGMVLLEVEHLTFTVGEARGADAREV